MRSRHPFADLNPTPIVQEARVKSEVPPASDAKATLKYWDDYRDKERARIRSLIDVDALLEQPDGTSLASPRQLRQVGLTIGEPPTPAGLKQAEINQMLNDVYEKGGSCDFALVTPEFAYERGLISNRRFKWLKFKRAIRGLLKRRGRRRK